MDVFLNDVKLSDLKIGAITCICIGYIFLILPEDFMSKLRKKNDSMDEMNSSSMIMARRYKYSTPSSPLQAQISVSQRTLKQNSISSSNLLNR